MNMQITLMGIFQKKVSEKVLVELQCITSLQRKANQSRDDL